MMMLIKFIKRIFQNKKSNGIDLKNTKFKIGEEVKITIYSNDPNNWYIGKIVDINTRFIVPGVYSSWKEEYYVSFKNDKGENFKYWFLDSELRKWTISEERNNKIEQILKDNF